MDKNTITGFVLIGLVIFAFSWFNKPSAEQIESQRQYNDSIAVVETARQQLAQSTLLSEMTQQKTVFESDSARMATYENMFGAFAAAVDGDEKIVSIENEVLALKFTSKGGMIAEAQLKNYQTHDALPVTLFDAATDKYGFTFVTANNKAINTAELFFEPALVSDSSIVMRLAAGVDSYIDFVYTLQPNDYIVKFDVRQHNMLSVLGASTDRVSMFWEEKLRRNEQGRVFEDRYSNLFYQFIEGDVDYLDSGKDVHKTFSEGLKWIGYKNQFFTAALISRNGFNGAIFDSKVIKDDQVFLKQFRTDTQIDFNISQAVPASFDLFLGPNSYPLLSSLDKRFGENIKLEKLVPLGPSLFRWVNIYLVLPVFTFLGKFIGNYGIIILLLTLYIKFILYPFTYKSHLSQAKMRLLRPEIQKITDKYPGQDNAMTRQQETMKLYGQAGVNPMGGCLPMLLQMPILFALFQFFPSSIELRGESFLWAHDLSTYDSIFSWDTYIPLVTPYFGNHISLFCILMTITNIVYNKLNMDANPGGQEQMPGMKNMMMVMPLMFLVFFNNYASGLSYYYFLSTLITIAQTYSFRFFINEDKLRAQMKANAKNPKKKTGFMARLEEAQRMQQDSAKRAQQQKK